MILAVCSSRELYLYTLYNRMEGNYIFINVQVLAGRVSEILLKNMFSSLKKIFSDQLKNWGSVASGWKVPI